MVPERRPGISYVSLLPPPPPSGISFDSTLLSPQEIRKATMQLKVSKSPGIDGILAEVYQQRGEAVLDKLQDLFTNCWEKGTLPQDPRDAVLVSVQKQKRKIRLCKLLRHHSTLHCRHNLGSRLAELAHPDDSTGKHARKPMWVQV